MLNVMKNRKRFFLSKLSYYIRYTLPILAAVILAIVVLFSFIYKISKDRVYDMYETSTEYGVKQFSSQIQSMSTMLMTMNNSNTGRFIFAKAPIDPSSCYSLDTFYGFVRNIASANQLYADILIYFPRADVLVSHFACYMSLAQYISMNEFSDPGLVDCMLDSASLSGFFTLPGCSARIYSGWHFDAAFIIGVPFAINSSLSMDNIYAYLMIDTEQLLSIFNLAVIPGASLHVLDKNGAELYSFESVGKPVNGKSFTVTEPTLGLSFVLEVDTTGLLMSNLKPIIIFILVAFLVCAGITIYCARQAALPMEQIAGRLKSLDLSRNPGLNTFIHESIEALDRRCTELQNALSNLETQQRDTLIDRCLFTHEDIQVPGLPDSFAVFYCVVSDIPSDTEDYLHILISQYFTEGLLVTVIPHILSSSSFMLILPVSSLNDSLIDKLSSLVASISKALNTTIRYTISSAHSGSASLRTAFAEAQSAYMAQNPSESGGQSNFPISGQAMIDRLSNAVRTANSSYAHQLIDLYLSQSNPLELPMRSSLVRDTLLSLGAERLPGQQAAEFGAQCLSSDLQPAFLHNTLDRLLKVRTETAEKTPEEEFTSFVRDQLSNESLSIQTLTEHFDLSEKAVYDLCHAATGKTPAAYIQQVRLEYACSLLRNSELKINEICDACGYNTLSTFYKAFKRAYNVTPSQYRQNFASPREE